MANRMEMNLIGEDRTTPTRRQMIKLAGGTAGTLILPGITAADDNT